MKQLKEESMEKAKQNYVFDARLTKSSGSSARSLRRNHNFFKIFFPDLSSKHLKIPPAFHQHILEEAPGRFYLKGPSNYIWGVDLVKKSDGLFFADGWDEFVSDHSLATGDFLLFQYNGNFMFSVMVFDNTACEKAKAFLAYPTCDEKVVFSVNEGHEREEFDAVLRIEEFGKRKRSAIDKITDCRVDAMPRTWSIFSQEFSRELVSVTSTGCKLYGSPSDLFNKALVCSRDFKTINSKRRKKDGSQNQGFRGFMSQRRPITQKEKDNALAKAHAFKSIKPFLMMVMKESYVYHGFYLALPGPFPFKHLPKFTREIFLHDPKKRQWTVNYICTKRPALSAGWCKFAVGNNLEVDDVCIFELIEEVHMKVHIFRVVEEIKPLLRLSEVNRLVNNGNLKALMAREVVKPIEEDTCT